MTVSEKVIARPHAMRQNTSSAAVLMGNEHVSEQQLMVFVLTRQQ